MANEVATILGNKYHNLVIELDTYWKLDETLRKAMIYQWIEKNYHDILDGLYLAEQVFDEALKQTITE